MNAESRFAGAWDRTARWRAVSRVAAGRRATCAVRDLRAGRLALDLPESEHEPATKTIGCEEREAAQRDEGLGPERFGWSVEAAFDQVRTDEGDQEEVAVEAEGVSREGPLRDRAAVTGRARLFTARDRGTEDGERAGGCRASCRGGR